MNPETSGLCWSQSSDFIRLIWWLLTHLTDKTKMSNCVCVFVQVLLGSDVCVWSRLCGAAAGGFVHWHRNTRLHIWPRASLTAQPWRDRSTETAAPPNHRRPQTGGEPFSSAISSHDSTSIINGETQTRTTTQVCMGWFYFAAFQCLTTFRSFKLQ